MQKERYNTPNYNSATFKEAIANSSSATLTVDHFKYLYEAQSVFMNDMPVIPVYHDSDTMLASDIIIGWDRSVLGTLDFSSATVNR